MRKTLLVMLIALLGLGVQQSKAQLDFGIVAGMNLSKADFKNAKANIDSKNRLGWFVGPKAEFTLPLIGLGADASILYSQRTINVDSEDGAKNNKLNTFEVPINVRWQFGLKSLAAVYVATGPQFGFNIGSGSIKDIKNVEYKTKNSILTWNIGAGVKVLKHVEAGLAYNIALSKFAKYTGTQESSLKSNTFQVHVGYFF